MAIDGLPEPNSVVRQNKRLKALLKKYKDDELYEPEIITPSEELEEYPELELDDELPLSDEEQQIGRAHV